MPLPDISDPSVEGFVSSFDLSFEPPDIAFEGSQVVRPVMRITHTGRPDAYDLLSAVLHLDIATEGTGCRGLLITGDTTLGHLIEVDNANDVTRYDLLMTADGRFGINTVKGNGVQARLEVAQADADVIGMILFAKAGSGEDLLQTINNSGVTTLWVDITGELHTIRNAHFVGPEGIQVGSHTMDIANVDGPAIGLTNLTSTTFTGTSTDGITIVATDGHLRYVDQNGVVWRLPDGNPLPELHELKAWNYDPTNATGSGEAMVGVLYLMKTLFHRSVQASTIRYHVLTATNSSVDDSYVGIYDLDGNLLTQSADISADLQSTGTKSAVMVSPPVMPPGYYYIAFLCGTVVGQGPKLAIAGVAASIANANLSAPNLRFASYGTAQTVLPDPVTMASQVSTSNQFWMGTA